MHCPEKARMRNGLNGEDLLPERGGTGLAQQTTLYSTPTARQGLWGTGERQLFDSCTASLLLYQDVIWQREKPKPSKTRTESKLPLSHHTEGASSHNNHYPSLLFSSFPFLLFSIHCVKIIAVSIFFSGQRFGTHCLQQTRPHQFSAYPVASKRGAASGWEYKRAFKLGALQVALPLLQAVDITWNCLSLEPNLFFFFFNWHE